MLQRPRRAERASLSPAPTGTRAWEHRPLTYATDELRAYLPELLAGALGPVILQQCEEYAPESDRWGAVRQRALGVHLVMDEFGHSDSSLAASSLQGRRVRLIRCDDPYTRLVPGTRGIVTLVDGFGTVHVAWDGGSRLGLIPGVDQWEVDAGVGPAGEEGNDIWSTEGQP